MSVKFDQAASNKDQALEAEYGTTQRLSDRPVSVSLWVRLSAAPPMNTAWTVWWFGEKDAGTNDLVLEAIEPASSGVRLRATLRGGTSLAATSGDLDLDDWHCVSVIVDGQSPSTTRLRLFIDGDTTAVEDSGAVAGLDYGDWDVFALAINRSGGPDNPGSFLAEQIAIWTTALGTTDTATMYDDKKPPWDMDPEPQFSYWVAAGHVRAGIEVERNAVWKLNVGDLYNQSSVLGQPALPALQVPAGGSQPTWRAATPAMLYANSVTITPVDRPPPKEPSRLQPHFVFNVEPQVQTDVPEPSEDVRKLAYYHDPNMSKYCLADYSSSAQFKPPYVGDVVPPYPPFNDMAQVARKMADWVEIQNFKKGTGVGPGGNYAGVIFLRGLGQGAMDKSDEIFGRLDSVFRIVGGQPRTIMGLGSRIPLEEHPLDWVLDVDTPWIEAPWQCWYRAEGSALVEEYMDDFWIALKQELDERGLCYPLRAHWDYEGWPRERLQLRYDTTSWEVERQLGCWPDVEADGRYTSEKLLNYSGSTISSMFTGITYDDDASITDAVNHDFWERWNAYSVMVRMEAVAESIMATLQSHFSYCRWSNYRAFVADNSGFKYPEGLDSATVPRWFNTPDAALDPDLVPAAQYSSPVLYSIGTQLNNLRGDYDERIGYTISEVVRDFNIMRVDAATNAIDALPLVPHVEDVGRSFYKENTSGKVLYDYVLTVEDSRALLSHLWRRGCDEYMMFSYNTDIMTYPDKIGVCQWLRDWVQSIPQARQDRVGRVSRLGRRGM